MRFLTKKILKQGKKFVEKIESTRASFLHWLCYLYGIFILRGILEGFLEHSHRFPKLIHLLVHWPFWYFNFLITIALILFFTTKEKIEKITRAVFLFSFLLLIVPLVDFLVSGGKGFILAYCMSTGSVLGVLLTFGGLYGKSIITPGESLAIWLAIVLIFFYVFIRNNSIRKAIVAVFLFYLAGTFYASFPLGLALLFGLEQSFNHEVAILTILFLLCLAVVQSIAWLYLYDRKIAKAFLQNLKLLRAGHYMGVTALGALFAVYIFPTLSFNLKSLFAALLSIFFAFEFCLVYNNIYDNYIPKNIKKHQYEKIGYGLLFFSLFFAALINTSAMVFLFLAIVMGLYYSIPPFRLKKLGFLNNLVIGLISVLASGIGFLSQLPYISKIPLGAGIVVFITFSLAANIKDLKDRERDGNEGIKTLPVLLGYKKGLKAVALLSSVSFIIAPALLGFLYLSIIGAFFGTLNYLLLNKVKREEVTFALYFIFAIIFGLALLYRVV
ncbi:MAG: UbiA family prenyltransferase [Candidatus Diapherotrites archaeon]|nr:UbiA family prenyltransferase [Candidatus Diapherotrites archaeon]